MTKQRRRNPSIFKELGIVYAWSFGACCGVLTILVMPGFVAMPFISFGFMMMIAIVYELFVR